VDDRLCIDGGLNCRLHSCGTRNSRRHGYGTRLHICGTRNSRLQRYGTRKGRLHGYDTLNSSAIGIGYTVKVSVAVGYVTSVVRTVG